MNRQRAIVDVMSPARVAKYVDDRGKRDLDLCFLWGNAARDRCENGSRMEMRQCRNLCVIKIIALPIVVAILHWKMIGCRRDTFHEIG